jgi:hypothetical protein
MRSTVNRWICGLLLVVLGFSIRQFQRTAVAERPLEERFSSESDGDLIAFSSPDAQQVTLIDKARQVMSVYHLDAKTGQITLRSIRCFRWDLEMDEFNGAEPSPAQIRSLIGSK